MKTLQYHAAAAIALSLSAAMTGCKQPLSRPDPNWQAAFAQSARQISFGEERVPEPDERVARTAYPTSALKVTYANGPVGDSTGLSARITSTAAYPRLGIAPGVNYVWTDIVRGRARQLVIPADPRFPARWLAITRHDHSAAQPRLVFRTAQGTEGVGLSYCSHCGVSGPPWCSGDSTSVEQIDQIPVDAFERYFTEHKVPRR